MANKESEEGFEVKNITKKFIFLMSFVLLFGLFCTPKLFAEAAITKVNIANPKSDPRLKEHFQRESAEGLVHKTDNGIEVRYTSGRQLIMKKSGKTFFKKTYHTGVRLFGVEGNLIYLNEMNQYSAGSSSKLIVLNTQGKTVYQINLNGAIVNQQAYGYIRYGDVLYFVTDRSYERLAEMGTDPSRKYSRVIGVSVKTGKILWQKEAGVVNQEPVLYKGRIYVTDRSPGSNRLLSFDSKGTETVHIADPSGFLMERPYFSPSGQVYLSGYDSTANKYYIRVYDQKFQLLRTQSYEGSFLTLTFNGNLALLSTYDFNGSDTGRLYAFNDQGKRLWSIKLKGTLDPIIVSGNNIFFLDRIEEAKYIRLENEFVMLDTKVYAVNKSNGAVVYKTGLGDYEFPATGLAIPGRTQIAHIPIIKETSTSGKKSYYLLK